MKVTEPLAPRKKTESEGLRFFCFGTREKSVFVRGWKQKVRHLPRRVYYVFNRNGKICKL